MASKCESCGKGPSWGMAVSHSHRRTKRRWNPNIQRVRALVNGSTKRLNVCTGCIKSGKIVKAGGGRAFGSSHAGRHQGLRPHIRGGTRHV